MFRNIMLDCWDCCYAVPAIKIKFWYQASVSQHSQHYLGITMSRARVYLLPPPPHTHIHPNHVPRFTPFPIPPPPPITEVMLLPLLNIKFCSPLLSLPWHNTVQNHRHYIMGYYCISQCLCCKMKVTIRRQTFQCQCLHACAMKTLSIVSSKCCCTLSVA